MRSRLKAALAVLLTALTLGGMAAAPAGAVTGGDAGRRGPPQRGTDPLLQRRRAVPLLGHARHPDGAAHRGALHGRHGRQDAGDVQVRHRRDQPPSGFPVAADPAAGYTQTELETAGFLSGTAYTHPEYSDFTDLDNWNDVGVIVLDKPVDGHHAGEGRAARTTWTTTRSRRSTRRSSRRSATAPRSASPTSGPQKPTPETYPLIRRNADQPGQKLTDQILQLNGNPNDTKGTGGTCFGDSGGPTFLNGYVVTVTSYAYTSNCRYLGGYQRVDIDVVAGLAGGVRGLPGGLTASNGRSPRPLRRSGALPRCDYQQVPQLPRWC